MIILVYIHPACSVVRHKAVESCPPEVVDKFRVDAFVGSKLIGRKQVLASVTREKVPEVLNVRLLIVHCLRVFCMLH